MKSETISDPVVPEGKGRSSLIALSFGSVLIEERVNHTAGLHAVQSRCRATKSLMCKVINHGRGEIVFLHDPADELLLFFRAAPSLVIRFVLRLSLGLVVFSRSLSLGRQVVASQPRDYALAT